MSAQFHTPSFGDEVFDLTDVEPMQTIEVANVNRYNATANQVMSGDDAKRGKVGVLTEPVKPSSAYALFFRDTVSAIKAQNPNTTFEDISKIVNSMWQVLDPAHKNVYNKKGEQAKKEYIKQITAYRNLQMRQQAAQEDASAINFEQVNAVQHPNISPKSTQIASRPAVFTISRQGGDAATPQHHDQQTVVMQNNIVYCNNANAQNNADNDDQQPQNVQISNETGSTQICIRENCNKRAVVNPDWEDEYCSNECVVIHCRNVFNHWVRSNMEGQG